MAIGTMETETAHRGGFSLRAAGLFIAVLTAAPLIGLCVSGLLGPESAGVFTSAISRYLANSLALAAGTAACTALIGVSAAWLVTMCEFPGRRIFEWALVLPLAAPAYIIAYAYSDFLQHAGPMQSALRELMDWGPRDYWFPNIRSLPGAILVLSFVLYPYVYLIVRAALLEQSALVLEAARSLGRTPWQSFFSVALPLTRPALVAGVSIVVMETLADFGTVAHFGVGTFTTAIYQAYSYLGNQALAAGLALVLLGIVLVLLAVERFERGRAATRAGGNAHRALPRYRLKGPQALAGFLACAAPVAIGALFPALILLRLALTYGHDVMSARYLAFIQHTLLLGLIGAAVTVAAALLIAYAARAARSRLLRAALISSVFGYAIPGSVIAIGVLIPLAALDNLIFRWMQSAFDTRVGLVLTGSIAALIYAYLVRFLAIAFRTAEQSLARLTPHIDAAARTLGASESGVIARVHLPMIRGSLLTAGLIVFVEIVKELPATLILRPFNLDTLATQAYRLASDERLAEASSASLVIFALGLVSVVFLTRTIARSRISERRIGERASGRDYL